jgi:NAD(P)-dependent dehydrogenase (short-subunit alcohol dehydrogenase family)
MKIMGYNKFCRGSYVVAVDVQDAKGEKLRSRFPEMVRYVRRGVRGQEQIATACASAAGACGGLDCIFGNAAAAVCASVSKALRSKAETRTSPCLSAARHSG